MSLLRAVARKHPARDPEHRFPFSVPIIRDLGELDVSAPVTFLVGENGSGKSTLLEGIATAAALPTVGSQDVSTDETLTLQRELGRALRLTWHRRTQRGFFLRAEDFFGFTRAIARLRSDLRTRLDEVEEEYADRSSYARGLARGPASASLHELEARYGADFDARSHGQGFLLLFQSRFVPGGLYLLDEPEAALSPQSQLALIALLKDMAAQDAQFIIATHSPILLAFPGASIYSCDEVPPRRVAYDDLESVTLTRAFLQSPEQFLRRL
jgi:predicted ATPase